MDGPPLTLAEYPATTIVNRHFRTLELGPLERFFLPPTMTGLLDEAPVGTSVWIEDDHRGAVSPAPVATIDGLPLHASVKGVGSTTDPYSDRPLDARSAGLLTENDDVRERLEHPRVPRPAAEPDRLITGERWLRGSPYGGQGWEHAAIALKVSERAEVTSLEGFRIAPVVAIAHLPPDLEERIRTLHWYRRFRGPIVQEVRLVPSNVRIYFHARQSIGNDVRAVFDRFGLDSPAAALRFEVAFVRSTMAMLSLFARTLRYDPERGRYFGLDYHDVWLDKDAVVAPDGTVFFVDLEGIDEESVAADGVPEKLEDQVYRSLYEFLFAYEQIDQERGRRFGATGSRKTQLSGVLAEALRGDRYLRLRESAAGTEVEIRNALNDEGLYTTFPLVDR